MGVLVAVANVDAPVSVVDSVGVVVGIEVVGIGVGDVFIVTVENGVVDAVGIGIVLVGVVVDGVVDAVVVGVVLVGVAVVIVDNIDDGTSLSCQIN